jgi:hypothetical protein
MVIVSLRSINNYFDMEPQAELWGMRVFANSAEHILTGHQTLAPLRPGGLFHHFRVMTAFAL